MRKRGIGQELWQNSVDQQIFSLCRMDADVQYLMQTASCGFCQWRKENQKHCTDCEADGVCRDYVISGCFERNMFALEWLHDYGVRMGYVKSTEETT